MNEMKCPECGSIVPANRKECPNCGYPIEIKEVENENIVVENTTTNDAKVTEESTVEFPVVNKETSSKKIRIMPIISFAIGVVMIIIGCIVMKQKSDDGTIYLGNTYSSNSYNVEDYSFGADFYSEIYQASNTIVDELDDINKNISSGFTDVNNAASAITGSINNIIDTIYFVSGVLIIVLGMGTVAISCLHMKIE